MKRSKALLLAMAFAMIMAGIAGYKLYGEFAGTEVVKER